MSYLCTACTTKQTGAGTSLSSVVTAEHPLSKQGHNWTINILQTMSSDKVSRYILQVRGCPSWYSGLFSCKLQFKLPFGIKGRLFATTSCLQAVSAIFACNSFNTQCSFLCNFSFTQADRYNSWNIAKLLVLSGTLSLCLPLRVVLQILHHLSSQLDCRKNSCCIILSGAPGTTGWHVLLNRKT